MGDVEKEAGHPGIVLPLVLDLTDAVNRFDEERGEDEDGAEVR
jgi:hypothetical protein